MSVWLDDWNEVGPDILLAKFADYRIGDNYSSDEDSYSDGSVGYHSPADSG